VTWLGGLAPDLRRHCLHSMPPALPAHPSERGIAMDFRSCAHCPHMTTAEIIGPVMGPAGESRPRNPRKASGSRACKGAVDDDQCPDGEAAVSMAPGEAGRLQEALLNRQLH
jgi:hypothetical protein